MAYIGRSVDVGIFEKQVLTPDSTTTSFALTYAVGSANSLFVVYGGVVQEPGVAYSVSGGGQTIVFSEAPATGTTLYIIYYGKQLTTPRAAGQETTKQTFSGDGTTTVFTLTDPPVVPAGIMVFVDGILQREGAGNNFVSSGSTISFTAAPDSGAEIDVYTLVKEKVSIDTVADGSITRAKLAASHPYWDAAGNVGITATPNSWKSTHKTLQLGIGANISGRTDGAIAYLSSNWYLNSSNQDIAINTGAAAMYSLNAGNHAWYTAPSTTAGGTMSFTQVMTLFNNGQLSLGQTSGGYPLALRTDPATSSNPMIYVHPNTSAYGSYALFNNTGSGDFRIGRSDSAGAGTGVTLGAYDTFIWNTGVQKMYFGTNNTTAMYIGTDQNVNVTKFLNVTTTGGLASFSSSGTGQGNIQFVCTDATTPGTGYIGMNAFTNSVFALGTSGTTNLPVEIYSNGSVRARIHARSAGSYIAVGAGMAQPGATYSGGLTVGMGSSGTNTRNASVVISGIYSSTGLPQWVSNWASSGAWGMGPDTGSNDSYIRLGLWSEDSSGFYWTGTYSNLKVSTLTQTSDYRIKENIDTIEDEAIPLVMALRPVRYNKIPSESKEVLDSLDPEVHLADTPAIVRREIGFIAHEVQAVIPEVVTGVKDAVDENGTPIIQGLDYDRLTAILVKAVQELKSELDSVKSELAALKAK